MPDLLLDFIRKIKAAQNFSIKDNFQFVKFEEVLEGAPELPGDLELWAVVKISYTGEIPESYKSLNLLIGDWVLANIGKLTEMVHAQLKSHFAEHFPNSEISDLDQVDDTAIWTDQLDYMPMVNESDQSMTIEIELVIHAEPLTE